MIYLSSKQIIEMNKLVLAEADEKFQGKKSLKSIFLVTETRELHY